MEYKFKYSAIANVEFMEETDELRKEVASVIDLPQGKDKQEDLLYFTAIYVSSGCNLNNAYFLPSELVKSSGTIANKAMDIEHSEDEIVGHIYDCAFTDLKGKKLELPELASMETASLDKIDMHIEIAGVVYKNRFPELADEVSQGEWKVSMETYYRNFDVKIGDIIVSNKEARSLGLDVANDAIFGTEARIVNEDKEIASGKVVRVLRDLLFSGCGFVKNPANPPSDVLETSSLKLHEKLDDGTVIELIEEKADKKESDNNVTSEYIEDEKDSAELQYNDTVGICVNYKKRVYNSTFQGPDTEVLHEDWCSRYDRACTSDFRSADDVNCLIHTLRSSAASYIKSKLKERSDSIDSSYNDLVAALDKAAEHL